MPVREWDATNVAGMCDVERGMNLLDFLERRIQTVVRQGGKAEVRVQIAS